MASYVHQQTSSHQISRNGQRSDGQTSSTGQVTDVKCILIGDSTIGKTSLVVSYTTDDYPAEHIPSALDTYCVQVCADNRMVNLQISDTGGGADVASLRRLSYPGVHVVLLCFSVVKPSSFRSLRTTWLEELTTAGFLAPRWPAVGPEARSTSSRSSSSAKCSRRRAKALAGGNGEVSSRLPLPLAPAFLLVGCACDLRNDIGHLLSLSREGETPVDKRSAEELAHQIGAEAYVECSALTQKNLKTAFDLAIWCGLRVADSRLAAETATWDDLSSNGGRLSTVSPGSLQSGSQSQVNGVRVDPVKPQTHNRDKPTSSLSSWRRYLCFSGNSAD